MDFRGRNIDLVGKQNLWFGISLALILIGMISWGAFGLNLGIDFKGGGQFQYRIPYSQRPKSGEETALLEKARASLNAKGLQKVRLQIAGGNTLIIDTDAHDDSELGALQRQIVETLGPQFKGTDSDNKPQELGLVSQQFVGPVIGEELKKNAVLGVVLGVSLIALWIYIRYNFAGDGLRYAVAGIIALVYDVLVLIGLFALIGRIDPRIEVNEPFIAALLTVVGYSINDSVVIFDRLRENLRLRRKESYNKVVNDSLLETMSRSINTGLTVVIMLLALLFFGGESIYNFVLAMLIGIVSGLYSSIFNASMVLTAWHAYDEKKLAAARTAGRPVTAGAATSTVGATAGSRAASTTAGVTPRRSTFATGGATPATTRPLSEAGASDAAADEGGTADGSSKAGNEAAARAAASRKARAKRRF